MCVRAILELLRGNTLFTFLLPSHRFFFFSLSALDPLKPRKRVALGPGTILVHCSLRGAGRSGDPAERNPERHGRIETLLCQLSTHTHLSFLSLSTLAFFCIFSFFFFSAVLQLASHVGSSGVPARYCHFSKYPWMGARKDLALQLQLLRLATGGTFVVSAVLLFVVLR